MNMEQYIKKSDLVAEIERRLWLLVPKMTFHQQRVELEKLISFLDTLEVKEVDLEKEIDKFYGMYRKDGQTFDIEDNEECVDWKVDCNPKFEIAFAKHFYELGIKAQKGD